MGRKAELENNISTKIKLTSRNVKQKELMRNFYDPSNRVFFALGPSGSGKTYMTVLRAMQLFTERKVNKIIISRPSVGADENLGYLPGPQPLDAGVLTPTGWTTMGDLKMGDHVISQDGTPTEVIGVYPKGTKSVYHVITTDGTSTECCEDHLWFTKTAEDKKRGRKGSVKSTKEIMESLEHKPSGNINHFLPRNEPVQYERKELEISPYELGCLLTDEHIENATNKKCIPDDYKYTSIEDRLALLQGLMDSGGTFKASNGEALFSTESDQLALDTIELIRSLGGKVTHKLPRKNKKSPSYEFNIRLPSGMLPFHCERKASRVKDTKHMRGVGIVSIEYVGEKEVQCIRVDNPDHLYITDEFIVTHNTLEDKMYPWVRPILDVMYEYWMPDSVSHMIENDQIEIAPLAYLRGRSFPRCAVILDEFQNSTVSQMKMALTRLGEESYMFVTGDENQSDLHGQANGLVDFCDRLEQRGSDMISICRFSKEYIVRDPVVQEVLNIYDATDEDKAIEEEITSSIIGDTDHEEDFILK